MNKVTVRELRANLSLHLKNLPVVVVDGRTGEEIAEIKAPGFTDSEKQIKLLKLRISELERGVGKKQRVTSQPGIINKEDLPF